MAHCRSIKKKSSKVWGSSELEKGAFTTTPFCRPPSHWPRQVLPFIICKLVSMVVGGDDVHEEDVLCFGVQTRHLDFVTGEHPPKERGCGEKPVTIVLALGDY